MAKDLYHILVKEALIKEGWTITHDPYPLRDWDPDWEIDLGAEKIIGAEKENQKIAVEVRERSKNNLPIKYRRIAKKSGCVIF